MSIIEHRCIVLVGKSGGGKSTIGNVLVGHDPLSDKAPEFAVSDEVLQSVTTEISHKVYKFKEDGKQYQLTVIDTVGLFDNQSQSTSATVNKKVLDQIEKYFKVHIKAVSVILFVFKKGRFTAEEEEVFSLLRSKFGKEVSPISALAVTGCENDTPEKRQAFIREFQTNGRTMKIADQMWKGIFPVGFPPVRDMPQPLQQAYKEGMARDQETLRDLAIRGDQEELTCELFEEKVLPKMKSIGCTIL